ncbi:uncharacterized protein LOC142040430 isoform X1 [Buteo buteo]|uniref:uncharacterized protein LOC142040430 isoform X1 n=1 Tax=Buteo buteo TaxID=30397 RepID=UPI003EBD9750
MVHPGIIHSGRFTVSEPHAEAGAGLRQQRRPGQLPGADQPDTREGRAALGREAGVSAKPRIKDPPEAGRANAEPHMELEDESCPPSGRCSGARSSYSRTRSSNTIWRAWYLQYVEERRNPACNFVTLLEARDRQEHCGL